MRTPDGFVLAPKGEPTPVLLSRGPGAPAHRRRVPADATLAEIAALLVGSFVPLRTTVDGRLAGWYRLGPPGGPLPAHTRVAEVPVEQVLHFHFVASAPVTVEVVAPGATLRLPLGSAVPLQSLVDAVAALLDLPAGDWALHLGDVRLAPAALLADHPVPPGARLVLR